MAGPVAMDTGNAANIMDSRDTFGVDMGFDVEAILWPLLKSLCRTHCL